MFFGSQEEMECYLSRFEVSAYISKEEIAAAEEKGAFISEEQVKVILSNCDPDSKTKRISVLHSCLTSGKIYNRDAVESALKVYTKKAT